MDLVPILEDIAHLGVIILTCILSLICFLDTLHQLLCLLALLSHVFLFAAAVLTQTVALSDCTVKFEIWDTAGQVSMPPA